MQLTRQFLATLESYGKFTYSEKMDSYDSTYKMTGFQSACAEYHEQILSLDERYGVGRPSVFIVEVSGNAPQLGIRSKDKLVVDRALVPRQDDLVILVIQNEFKLIRFEPRSLKLQDPESGDFIWGVVTTLLREFK